MELEHRILLLIVLVPIVAAGYYICKILVAEDSADARDRMEREYDAAGKTKDLQR